MNQLMELELGEPMNSNELNTEQLRLTICRWFNRRPTTKWTPKELAKLKMVAKLGTHPDDLASLDSYYSSPNQFKRKDVETLLNNWNGEIDRAKANAAPIQTASNSRPQREPTIHELKTVLDAKIALRNGLRERFSIEGPLGREWQRPEKRQEAVELTKEIKSLQERIAKQTN